MVRAEEQELKDAYLAGCKSNHTPSHPLQPPSQPPQRDINGISAMGSDPHPCYKYPSLQKEKKKKKGTQKKGKIILTSKCSQAR